MKFFVKDFFGKCDQIRSFLRICSHLLKKSLMENFIFLCSVSHNTSSSSFLNFFKRKFFFYNLFPFLFFPHQDARFSSMYKSLLWYLPPPPLFFALHQKQSIPLNLHPLSFAIIHSELYWNGKLKLFFLFFIMLLITRYSEKAKTEAPPSVITFFSISCHWWHKKEKKNIFSFPF